MRRLLAAAAVAAALLGPAPATADAASTERGVVELGGVRVELRDGTTQVVTVDHTRGTGARVSLRVGR